MKKFKEYEEVDFFLVDEGALSKKGKRVRFEDYTSKDLPLLLDGVSCHEHMTKIFEIQGGSSEESRFSSI